MSKRKRARIKQEKQNTPTKKAKRAKKEYYKSEGAKDKWEKKKQQRQAENAGRQQRGGDNQQKNTAGKASTTPAGCKLLSFQTPGKCYWCVTCELRCLYAGSRIERPAGCKLPEKRTPGGFWCRYECNIKGCPYMSISLNTQTNSNLPKSVPKTFVFQGRFFNIFQNTTAKSTQL